MNELEKETRRRRRRTKQEGKCLMSVGGTSGRRKKGKETSASRFATLVSRAHVGAPPVTETEGAERG